MQETLPQLKTHELPQNCFSLSSMCIQLSHLQYGTHVHDLYRVREQAYAYLISEFVHLATYFCVRYPATLHSECCIPAFYLFVGHCCRATWRVVPACLSLFAKSLGTCFDCIQQAAFHPLVLCSCLRYKQKCFMWPCSKLLGFCLSQK